MKQVHSTDNVKICHSLADFEDVAVVKKEKKKISPWVLFLIKTIVFIIVGIIAVINKTFPAYIALMSLSIITIFSFIEVLFQTYKAIFTKISSKNYKIIFNELYLKTYQFIIFIVAYVILNAYL